MPEIAAGKTTRSDVVILRAPRPYEASRRFCGTARIASSATEATSGIDRIPTPSPAAARLNELASSNSGLITRRRQQGQGEEPQDDAGNASEDLEDRLDGPAELRRGVLGEVDRREEADRRRDHHRDHRDDERPDHDGRDVEDAAAREPSDAEQLAEVDLRQEADRLDEDRFDDEQADQDRDQRRSEEQAADDRLATPPARAAAQRYPGREGWTCLGHRWITAPGGVGRDDSRGYGNERAGRPRGAGPFAEEERALDYFDASQAVRVSASASAVRST